MEIILKQGSKNAKGSEEDAKSISFVGVELNMERKESNFTGSLSNFSLRQSKNEFEEEGLSEQEENY